MAAPTNGERALGHWMITNAAVVLLLLSWLVGGGVLLTKLAAADEALATYGRENRRRIEQCEKQDEDNRRWQSGVSEDLAVLRTVLGVPKKGERR